MSRLHATEDSDDTQPAYRVAAFQTFLSGRISTFGDNAIRARLRPSRQALDDAYRAAAREPWRKAEADEWAVTDIEDWPA